MTTCTTGPNGGRCHVCVVWDEAMHRVRMAEGEHAKTKYWKQRQHDAMQSTIAKLEKLVKRQRSPRHHDVGDFLGEIRERIQGGRLVVNGKVFSIQDDEVFIETLLDAMIAETK